MNLVSLILALAIIGGQIIKFPLSSGGISLLDLTVVTGVLLRLNKFHLRKPPLFITAASIFIFISILSLIFTPLHLQSGEYLTGFFYILRFSAYILFGYFIYSKNLHLQINHVLVYSGVGLAILGLLQFLFLPDLSFMSKYGWDPHYFRTVSTFFDPNFAGAYFTLTLLLLQSRLRGSSMIFIIIYLALLTTFSRSSYLMFLISGLTLSFLKGSKTLFVKILVLFLILFLAFNIYTQAVAKPRNIERGKSASSRLNTWQQGWQLFSSHPLLGIGFNTYRVGLREFKLGDEQFLQSHGSSSNDSSLLFVAATTGILGFVAYLFFLISLIKQALKKNLILASAIIGLVIHSLFANSLFYPPILVWIILMTNQKEATSS